VLGDAARAARLPGDAERAARVAADAEGAARGAAYAPTLALTVALALAGCLLLISTVLLVVHPPGSGFVAQVIIAQNQSAKTTLYLTSFVVVLRRWLRSAR
jgi:hypothetical protein